MLELFLFLGAFSYLEAYWLLLPWEALAASFRALARTLQSSGMGATSSPPALKPVWGEDGLITNLKRDFNALAAAWAAEKETLGQERDRLQAILASLTDGVLLIGAGGEILLANPAFAAIVEWRDESLVGKKVVEVIRSAPLLKAIQNTLATGKEQSLEEEWLGPATRTVQAHILPFTLSPTTSSSLPGVLVILQDVTELRHLEQIRRDFVQNVSHELRTPLTSIKGYLETILQEGFADKEQSLAFLKIADREAERLSRLIDDLLVLSRLEQPRPGTERRMIPLDLKKSVDESVAMVAVMAAGRNITLKNGIPADFPLISGDYDLLRQVLNNLLDNAVKYSGPGTTVEVTASVTAPPEHKPAFPAATVCVRDQGIGIPAQDLQRIFERFYRVDKARSRAQGGTGLGLSIARHAVERMGGEIWAESEVGRGSAFFFTVPLAVPGGISARRRGETSL